MSGLAYAGLMRQAWLLVVYKRAATAPESLAIVNISLSSEEVVLFLSQETKAMNGVSEGGAVELSSE